MTDSIIVLTLLALSDSFVAQSLFWSTVSVPTAPQSLLWISGAASTATGVSGTTKSAAAAKRLASLFLSDIVMVFLSIVNLASFIPLVLRNSNAFAVFKPLSLAFL